MGGQWRLSSFAWGWLIQVFEFPLTGDSEQVCPAAWTWVWCAHCRSSRVLWAVPAWDDHPVASLGIRDWNSHVCPLPLASLPHSAGCLRDSGDLWVRESQGSLVHCLAGSAVLLIPRQGRSNHTRAFCPPHWPPGVNGSILYSHFQNWWIFMQPFKYWRWNKKATFLSYYALVFQEKLKKQLKCKKKKNCAVCGESGLTDLMCQKWFL